MNDEDFGRNVALSLFKALVEAAPGRSENPEAARAAAYRETLGRMNFETRTVYLSDFDAGEVGEGCLHFAAAAIGFGVWLGSQGIKLRDEAFLVKPDQ